VKLATRNPRFAVAAAPVPPPPEKLIAGGMRYPRPGLVTVIAVTLRCPLVWTVAVAVA
jgi:hypothetical protein